MTQSQGNMATDVEEIIIDSDGEGADNELTSLATNKIEIIDCDNKNVVGATRRPSVDVEEVIIDSDREDAGKEWASFTTNESVIYDCDNTESNPGEQTHVVDATRRPSDGDTIVDLCNPGPSGLSSAPTTESQGNMATDVEEEIVDSDREDAGKEWASFTTNVSEIYDCDNTDSNPDEPTNVVGATGRPVDRVPTVDLSNQQNTRKYACEDEDVIFVNSEIPLPSPRAVTNVQLNGPPPSLPNLTNLNEIDKWIGKTVKNKNAMNRQQNYNKPTMAYHPQDRMVKVRGKWTYRKFNTACDVTVKTDVDTPTSTTDTCPAQYYEVLDDVVNAPWKDLLRRCRKCKGCYGVKKVLCLSFLYQVRVAHELLGHVGVYPGANPTYEQRCCNQNTYKIRIATANGNHFKECSYRTFYIDVARPTRYVIHFNWNWTDRNGGFMVTAGITRKSKIQMITQLSLINHLNILKELLTFMSNYFKEKQIEPFTFVSEDNFFTNATSETTISDVITRAISSHEAITSLRAMETESNPISLRQLIQAIFNNSGYTLRQKKKVPLPMQLSAAQVTPPEVSNTNATDCSEVDTSEQSVALPQQTVTTQLCHTSASSNLPAEEVLICPSILNPPNTSCSTSDQISGGATETTPLVGLSTEEGTAETMSDVEQAVPPSCDPNDNNTLPDPNTTKAFINTGASNYTIEKKYDAQKNIFFRGPREIPVQPPSPGASEFGCDDQQCEDVASRREEESAIRRNDERTSTNSEKEEGTSAKSGNNEPFFANSEKEQGASAKATNYQHISANSEKNERASAKKPNDENISANSGKEKGAASKITNDGHISANSEKEEGAPAKNLRGIIQAPIYQPTEEDFQDPITYFKKIMPEAAKYGLCKVVAPKGFKPKCTLNNDMRFSVTNQYICRLFNRWGEASQEMCAIKSYLATQRVFFLRPPLLEGVEVNLPKLYQLVQRLGGLKQVIEKKRWTKVAEEMRLSRTPKADKRIDKIYVKYILPYDTLSDEERSEWKKNLEKVWQERHKKMVERANNPLHRMKRLLGESDSSEEDEITDMYILEVLSEAEDCFVNGRVMSLATFKKVGKKIMDTYFFKKTSVNVENFYWQLVKKSQDHLCVNTASIDTGEEGYGFPKNPREPCGQHPWNLKMLSENNGNVLRCLGPVLGVTVPTLHLGMVFSTSCWHRDPHGLPWIEYLHNGPSKIWYGIPESESANFRTAAVELCPSLCQNKLIWLPSDIVMIPPDKLLEYGVGLTRIVQNPGEFVIVFPKSYSCSISTGYTESESVYFATDAWLDSVQEVFNEVRESCEPTMFPLEKLLLAMTHDSTVPVEQLRQVYPLLKDIIQEEIMNRANLSQYKIRHDYSQPDLRQCPSRAWNVREQEECEICRTTLYFSRVCGLIEKSSVCTRHALMLFNAQKDDNYADSELQIFFTESELRDILTKIECRIAANDREPAATTSGTENN